MLKFSVVCLYFAAVAVNLWNVNCITEEEAKAVMEAMKPMADECASDCGLTEEDYMKHGQGGDLDPCFKKCMLQKIGVLDQEGKYDKDAMQDSISKYTGDKDQAQKMKDQLDSCFDANGDNNGDDEASQLKRIDVLFKCFKELK